MTARTVPAGRVDPGHWVWFSERWVSVTKAAPDPHVSGRVRLVLDLGAPFAARFHADTHVWIYQR